MDDALDRQVEGAVVVGQPGQAARGHGDAVIALQPRHDLLLVRAAQRIVHVPHHLDDGVVGLRARVGEEHLRHLDRRHHLQLLGEVDGGLVGALVEGVVKRQLLHLLVGHRGQPLVAEAQRRRPQAGHALDVLLAVVVGDVDAAAAHDGERTGFLVLLEVGVGVQVVRNIPRRVGIAAEAA
jgi:hypothetical protein